MTASSAQLAEAKAEYEEQVFDLFEDLDPAPVLLRSAAEYVVQLAAVGFRDPEADPEDFGGQPWALWALAPPDKRWAAWAASTARDQDRGWLGRIEHVWLTRDGALCQALVDIEAGLIVKQRLCPVGTRQTSKERNTR